MALIWPCAELHRGLTSSRLSPSNLSAAHLAGFMGKELTSGRLPCYPSSVWKLILSSVSKLRDPLAGGITWVPAVGASPSPLPPLWTAVVLSTWTPPRKLPLHIRLPYIHFLFTSPASSWPSQSSLSIDQARGGQSCGWELCNSISCCRCRTDLQMHASWKKPSTQTLLLNPVWHQSDCLTKTQNFSFLFDFFFMLKKKRGTRCRWLWAGSKFQGENRLSAPSALRRSPVFKVKDVSLTFISSEGKCEKSSLSFPLIICVHPITISKENSLLSNDYCAERTKLYHVFAGTLMRCV